MVKITYELDKDLQRHMTVKNAYTRDKGLKRL